MQKKLKLNRRILIGFCAILMVIVGATTAGATGYSVDSQFSCSGRLGDSWLNWAGYSWWNDGTTNAALWRDTGGWHILAQGQDSDNGSSGLAIVHFDEDDTLTGYFEVKGSHTSDFFSGTLTSTSGQKPCW